MALHYAKGADKFQLIFVFLVILLLKLYYSIGTLKVPVPKKKTFKLNVYFPSITGDPF